MIWLSLLSWVSWREMGEFVNVGEFGDLVESLSFY